LACTEAGILAISRGSHPVAARILSRMLVRLRGSAAVSGGPHGSFEQSRIV
jgi:hypothetical protein